MVAAAGSAVASKAFSQSTSRVGAPLPDAAKQALDAVSRNADTLAKFPVPISTEPAFQFKA
jgi:hypothetical protein